MSLAPAFPSPPKLPVLGHLLQVWQDPLELFMSGVQRCGPNVHFRFLHHDYVLLTDPASVQHVLVGHPERYVKSDNYAPLKLVLGNGLLTSEGDFWRKQRKLIQPAFHKQRLASFVSIMTRQTDELIEDLERRGGAPFDLHAELMRLTFRIVGLALLSQDLDGDARAVGQALGTALHWANEQVASIVRSPLWLPTPSNRRFLAARRTLDALVTRIVQDRRALGQGARSESDLLDMLLEARDELTGEGMDDAQIRHELLTMVLAGHETTANALSFLFVLLARHPEVHARIHEEVTRVLGDQAPSLESLRKLEITTAVIEEAMRLYPPAWVIERQASEPDQITGVPIAKGTMIAISPFAVHRSDAHWPHPERFDFTRFLPDRRGQIGKHVYMPFGGGHRFCIGNQFAMMEMQILTAMLVRRCRFELTPDFRLELDPQVTLRPKRGVQVVVKPPT